MSITPERKSELIGEYATKDGDTGSPEVQVAIRSSISPNISKPTARIIIPGAGYLKWFPSAAGCLITPSGATNPATRN